MRKTDGRCVVLASYACDAHCRLGFAPLFPACVPELAAVAAPSVANRLARRSTSIWLRGQAYLRQVPLAELPKHGVEARASSLRTLEPSAAPPGSPAAAPPAPAPAGAASTAVASSSLAAATPTHAALPRGMLAIVRLGGDVYLVLGKGPGQVVPLQTPIRESWLALSSAYVCSANRPTNP